MAFWRHDVAGQVTGDGDRQHQQPRVFGSGRWKQFFLSVEEYFVTVVVVVVASQSTEMLRRVCEKQALQPYLHRPQSVWS
jgi:hypothetical protein